MSFDSASSLSIAPAHGIADPTLSLNLSTVNDYAAGVQFLDQMKMARSWSAHGTDGKSMQLSELKSGGHLDADGWPTHMPEGINRIGTLWEWSSWDRKGEANGENVENKAGTYVVDYKGEGKVSITGDVKILSSEQGHITFHSNGKNFFLGIEGTDPNETGNYVRDITMVAEKHYDLFQAGAIFNPDWVGIVEDARDLRFMSWSKVETASRDGTPIDWDDRPTHGGVEGAAVPLADMVALANQTRSDPWFTIPHGATEDYIRNYATYVRDHVDPGLKITVEWSNEAWNWGYNVTQWLGAKSNQEWGTPGGSGFADYQVKLAVENALIWKDVFGEDAKDRLVNVLGSQAVNEAHTRYLLNPKIWAQMEPDKYVDPKTVFDAVGVTTYFGHSHTGGAYRDALLAAIKDPDVDATDYLFRAVQDPTKASSIPQIAKFLEQQKAAVEKYDIKLIAYEGGQHMHQLVHNLNAEDSKLIDDFLTDFVRSPQMAELYKMSWDSWAKVSDGAYMQHADIGRPSKYGSWSFYETLETPTLRGEVLEERNATTTPWWTSEDPGDRYQQGVTLNGTDGDDVMAGTIRNDFLIGGAGNDTFRGGGGNDGIHGGAGLDRAIFAGSVADYTVTLDGKGYRVEGPDGTDRFVDVEDIEFDGGIVVHLPDLEPGIDGIMPLPGSPADPDLDPELAPTEPAAVTFESLVSGRGRIADIAEGRTVDLEINAINAWSAAGRQLGLSQSGLSAYTTNGRGAVVTIEGQDVRADYWSLNEGRTGRDAAPLPGNALSVARAFGELVSDTPVVRAGSGNDRFYGRDKDDAFDGGAGNDYIAGGEGNDILSGGAGHDVLNGGKGDDLLLGGSGVDTFRFRQGEGADTIFDYGDGDILEMTGWFGDGVSVAASITYGDGGAILSNGTDSVMLVGVTQKDTVYVKENETITRLGDVNPGEARIEVGQDGQGVVVTSINSWSAVGKELGINITRAPAFSVHDQGATGEVGGQQVRADYWMLQENRASKDAAPLSDNPLDTINALGTLEVNAKTILMGSGNDRFEGRDEASSVFAGAGRDALLGGGGDDVLDGGAGNDYIDGGRGNDVLIGGEGADTFKFYSGSGQDIVRDFEADDHLHLVDWFPDKRSFESALSFDDQGVTISNGTDAILFEGVFNTDMNWFQQSIL